MTPFEVVYCHPPPTVVSCFKGKFVTSSSENESYNRQVVEKFHLTLVIGFMCDFDPIVSYFYACSVTQSSVGDFLAPSKLSKELVKSLTSWIFQNPSCISCLRSSYSPSQQITPLELLDQSSSFVLLPEVVIQTRIISRGGHQVHQCLIKWTGLPSTDALWEDTHTLLQRFPDQNLGDKVHLHGGGIVTNIEDKSEAPRGSTRDKKWPKHLDQYVVPNPKRMSSLPRTTRLHVDSLHHVCPICRHELGNIRCLALEKIAESLELPCRYQVFGCQDIFTYHNRLQREQNCKFRPFNCPYAGSECTVTGDI
ncbi:hypothetical protein KY285_009448 [Solanum tuberosum]|nr:hypothetical protein KY285_009448 [Solanum tuberosum]